MRFYGALTSEQTIQPPTFNPATLEDKYAGWWVDSVSQLAAVNDLADDGTNITMPTNTILQDSNKLISLDDWSSSVIKSSIAPFCASRQFFKSSTNELIIIKKGEHLTSLEESNLLSYFGVSDLHSYHANSISLFSRFTNSYSNSEKSRLDNVMRLLVDSGIYTKLDHFYLASLSKKEEQLLDWIEATNNLVSDYTTANVPYKGLAPQSGSFHTSVNLNNDTNISLNSAFTSFKLGINMAFPDVKYFLKANGNIQFHIRPYVLNGKIAYAINLLGNVSYIDVDGYVDRTFVANRISSSIVDTYINNNFLISSSKTSTIIPTEEIVIGSSGAATMNYVQHIAWGSSLTSTQANLLTVIVDNFIDGQKELDTEYTLFDTDKKVTILDKFVFAFLGNKILWITNEEVRYSEDFGATIHSSYTVDNHSIFQMAHIFDNGNILFALDDNKLYLSDDKLSTVNIIIPTKDGVDYIPHTTQNENGYYPGEYYKLLTIPKRTYLDDGTEILVWGNYGNVKNGANPNVIWYSFGTDVKVAFEFGINPYYTNNGTLWAGGTDGILLGDASSEIRSRHNHGTQQRPDAKNTFYAMGGDYDRLALTPAASDFYESNWIELVYNQALDTWSSSIALEDSAYTRAKSSSGQMPGDGYIYYTSDATPDETNSIEFSFWKTTYANLHDISLHTAFHTPNIPDTSLGMFHLDEDGFFMCGGYSVGGQTEPGIFNAPNIIYSDDMINFHEVTLPIPGNMFFFTITKISTKKYLLNAMNDYNYRGVMSIILDFN